MPHADFVHLRVHTAYSLSEGAIKADKLAILAEQAGMPAVAITDSGNMFGALEFSQYCAQHRVQPIIGCQLHVTRADNPALPPDPIVLLAQNAEGFAQLQHLSSEGFLETDPADKPQLPLERICARASGLLLLAGGAQGPIGRLLAEGQKDEAERMFSAFLEAFPGRTIMELQRHGLPVERAVEPGLIALADAHDVPLVATNEAYFARPEMHEGHDALLAIAEGRLISDPDRRHVTAEHWFKPAAEMRKLFADLPEACDNTIAIAQQCAVMAEKHKPMLPVCPKVREGATEEETVRKMAWEGLEKRFQVMQPDAETEKHYRERLTYELDVISKMKFPGYFLIVADFIQWAKAHGIPVGPGRGSGASSLTAWALTITELDPLRFNLLFERFLNPERISMPDFDVDFCQERRDEVIKYVRREYGFDRVAQIITFGKLQARAAVRDVGRALGLPFGQVNKVAELIPNNPAKPVTLQQAIDGEPKLQQLREEDEAVRRLLEVALQVEGLYRHTSTHAAGVVIGHKPLTDLVPIYRDPKSDFLVTQYSMKYVEQAGLVKFDFLGLTTLTILQRAVGYLHKRGIDVDLAHVPLDDPGTFDLFQRGDTGGVFQFESQGMRDVLRQMRPDRFEDLIAANALYRPGPMVNIPAYCARKHGEKWDAPHPSIRGILEETYGIMVYQEQVMQIAQKMAGYSLGGADLLRRAMGKKIRAEMEKQRGIFVEGAVGRDIEKDKAEEVFDMMAKFADYGFNKSHSAAYAFVAYQTAWLKVHHPAALFAACMSLAIANTDKLAALRQEAGKTGVRILPPDINHSAADFSLEDGEKGEPVIRYALAAVKKVGLAAMQSIEATRGDKPFADIAEFADRIDAHHVNRMQMENLVRAGAFDSLDSNRARVFAGCETILRRAQASGDERESGQIGLFGAAAEKPETLRLPDIPDWPAMDRLAYEAEAIGFHLTAHPLDAYGAALRRLDVVPSNRMEERAQAGSARVKLAGSVVGIKERITRTGSRMAWVRLSDAAGSYEITCFSEVLGRARELLQAGQSVLVTADLRLDGEALRVTAHDVASLDSAAQQAGAGMRVWIREIAAVGPLHDLLVREGHGRGRVILMPRLEGGQDVEMPLPGGFNVGPRLSQALKLLPGIERVEDI